MAVALEAALTDWVNIPDQCARHGVEDDAVFHHKPSGYSPEDTDVILVDLTEDGSFPWSEVWDVDQLPCLCAHPYNLHRA